MEYHGVIIYASIYFSSQWNHRKKKLIQGFKLKTQHCPNLKEPSKVNSNFINPNIGMLVFCGENNPTDNILEKTNVPNNIYTLNNYMDLMFSFSAMKSHLSQNNILAMSNTWRWTEIKWYRLIKGGKKCIFLHKTMH